MIVTTTYSSRLRSKMTPDDWAAIRSAGRGEVRFGPLSGGDYWAEIRTALGKSRGHGKTPRAAFDKALGGITGPQIMSVLG